MVRGTGQLCRLTCQGGGGGGCDILVAKAWRPPAFLDILCKYEGHRAADRATLLTDAPSEATSVICREPSQPSHARALTGIDLRPAIRGHNIKLNAASLLFKL